MTDREVRDSLLLLSNLLCKLTGDQLLCSHFYSAQTDESSYTCDFIDNFEENCDNILNYLEMCAVLLKHKSLNVDGLRNRRYRALLDKVHQTSSISNGTPLLTVNEYFTFQDNGSSANEYLNRLYELCDIAESHIMWMKKKDIFLKWVKLAVNERLAKKITGKQGSSSLKTFLFLLPELMERKENHDRWPPTKNMHEKLLEIESSVPSAPQHVVYQHRFHELINVLRERDKLLMVRVPRGTS